MDRNTTRGQNENPRGRATEQEWELSEMMKKFHATGEEVQEAVKAVGTSREKVEDYLKKRTNGRGDDPGNVRSS